MLNLSCWYIIKIYFSDLFTYLPLQQFLLEIFIGLDLYIWHHHLIDIIPRSATLGGEDSYRLIYFKNHALLILLVGFQNNYIWYHLIGTSPTHLTVSWFWKYSFGKNIGTSSDPLPVQLMVIFVNMNTFGYYHLY